MLDYRSAEHLLSEVKTILAERKAEGLKQGKEFNIFYIQQTAEDEKKVCRFIAELINPNGSHGQRELFLRWFIRDVIKLDDTMFSEDDYTGARITLEERITGARRIDLVVRIKKQIFPIEVKVYAEDQKKQCYDYYNYICKLDSAAKVYYLTLDGHEPSEYSKYTLKKSQYECISFSKEILAWIDDCIHSPEIEQIYPIREILIQFRTVLRDLTGQNKGTKNMELQKMIESSYENVVAAIQISNTLPDVKTKKMKEIFKHIKDHMSSRGYVEIESFESEVEKYYRGRNRAWPGLSYEIPSNKTCTKEKMVLRIAIDDWLYYGIKPETGKEKTQEGADIATGLLPKAIEAKESPYFYWWTPLLMGKTIGFYSETGDFLKLFDKEYYKEYLNEIDSIIDDVVIPTLLN